MKQIKFEKPTSNNATTDSWLYSFSDVVTLLITFFVLIISMSSMDQKAVKASLSYFEGKPGVMGSDKGGGKNFVYYQRKFNISKNDYSMLILLLQKHQVSDEQGIKLLKLEKIIGKGYNYTVLGNDVIFKINSNKFFNLYNYTLKPGGKVELLKFVKVLQEYRDKCYITFYTSDFPIKTTTIKNNIDLTVKRASVVSKILFKKINPERIFISAWGNRKLHKDLIEIKLKNYIFIKKEE